MSINSFIDTRFGITTHFCAGIWSLTSLYFILSFEARFYKLTILWLYLTIWGIVTAHATIRAWFWVSIIFFVSWFWSKWIMHDKWSSHWGAGKPRPLCHELSAFNTNTTAFLPWHNNINVCLKKCSLALLDRECHSLGL